MALQPRLAPAPVSAALPDATIAVRVELTRPLTGHNGPVQVIDIREPTMGDYVDCGPLSRKMAHDPRFSHEMKIEIADNPQALMAWMVRLTGQQEAVLRQLGARDSFAVKSEIERLVSEIEAGNSSSAPPR
jgi:hypothetical protein